MDPALQELLEVGEPTDEVAVVVRLRDPGQVPASLRIVAPFGAIATARVQRLAVRQVWEDPGIISLKAPRWYATEYGPVLDEADAEDIDETDSDQRRPDDVAATGRGTVIGVVDWGCDFAHPDFVTEDGRSRLLALWDQRTLNGDGNPYGYGRVHRTADLSAALKTDDPYAALGYHPGISDTGIGSHGTHVLSIAAGNGRGGGPVGLAPEADLIFVHLGAPGWDKLGPLGDSSNLLEAIHFVVAEAVGRPLVINMSIGRHAGEHRGTTLVEQALDWLVRSRPGTAVVQSTGNYFARNVHSSGRLRSGQTIELPFQVNPGDTTPNELEVWYSGGDVFGARLIGPDGAVAADAPLGGKDAVVTAGARTGTLYHRVRDPNNGDNHINLFQYRGAPSGTWRLLLRGIDVTDGRYHAWLERDPGCKACQALFPPSHAVSATTTGSICNGLLTISVGAYDGHDPARPLAPFSSSGPTRDGRVKPVLLAPGVKILAARSHPKSGVAAPLTRMSGTSMAAPHVAGTIALMFEAGGPLDSVRLRQALFDSLVPIEAPDWSDRDRVGFGFLDTSAAVQHAAAFAAAPAPPAMRTSATVQAGDAVAERNEPVAAEAPAGESAEHRPPALPSDGHDESLFGIEVAAPLPREWTESETAAFESENATGSPELEERAMSCGERCKTCEHCRHNPCETCPCCHPQAATESVLETAAQSVDEAAAWEGQDEAWSAHAHDAPGETDEGARHPVDAAEMLLDSGIHDPTRFLTESLSNTGRPWPEGCTPRGVFDDLTGRRGHGRRLDMERYFEIVGRPGRPLSEAPQPGDLVIRRGDGGFAHVAMIAHPLLYREHDAASRGLVLEGPWPGYYAHIIEPGMRPHGGRARFARRLSRPNGRILPDTLVVRARGEAVPAAEGAGEGAEAEPDPNIRWLQLALNSSINAGLVVDGLDGPATRDAIRRFQAARGLQVDGIAGPQTRTALRQGYEPGYPPPGGYRPPPPPRYQPPPPPPGGYRPPPPPPKYQPPPYTPPYGYPPPPPPGGYRPPPPPPGYRPPPPGYRPPPPPPGGYRPPPPPPGYRPPPYTPPYGYPPPPPAGYTPPGRDYPPPPDGYGPPPGGDYPPPPPDGTVPPGGENPPPDGAAPPEAYVPP
ncbi:MAG TPA: S8 family serine peptidase, partial [Xanthobacteraceae bacterium]